MRCVHSDAFCRAKNRADEAAVRAAGGRAIAEPGLSAEQLRRVPDVEMPVVLTHPVTGRRRLFVNEAYTSRLVELPPEEDKALLAELCGYILLPEFRYRHRWQRGDLLPRDNCAARSAAQGNLRLRPAITQSDAPHHGSWPTRRESRRHSITAPRRA